MPSYVLPTLELGSRGENTRRLQQYLNQLGYGIAIDAVFGPETRQAVMQFQAQAGVPIDGIVGPRTWEAIEVNLGISVDVEREAPRPPQIPDADDSAGGSWLTPERLAIGGLILAGAASLLYGGRSRS